MNQFCIILVDSVYDVQPFCTELGQELQFFIKALFGYELTRKFNTDGEQFHQYQLKKTKITPFHLNSPNTKKTSWLND